MDEKLLYTTCVSNNMELPNFGNNFVKSLPIFKILSLLERKLNVKQKSYNLFTSTRLKKSTTATYPRFSYYTNLAQFKWDARGNVTIQQVIDIFTSFARNLPFGPHTSSNTTAPLVNCTVNNALFHTVPNARPTNVASVQWLRELATVDALLDAADKANLTSSDTGTINK